MKISRHYLGAMAVFAVLVASGPFAFVQSWASVYGPSTPLGSNHATHHSWSHRPQS